MLNLTIQKKFNCNINFYKIYNIAKEKLNREINSSIELLDHGSDIRSYNIICKRMNSKVCEWNLGFLGIILYITYLFLI